MTRASIITALAIVFLFTSCAGKVKRGGGSTILLEGMVQGISKNEVSLLLKMPGSPVTDMAQQLVQKSLLFEGLMIEANGQPATVKEKRGDAVLLVLGKPVSFTIGTVLQLKLPKKIIAVVDFEVIRGNVKEAGRVIMEGLATALIESDQFIVIERSKLEPIMNELQLSLTLQRHL